MKRFFVIAAGLVLLTAGTVSADAGKAHPGARSAADATHAQASHAEDWRMRFHDGRWWYWQPDNTWAVHVDGDWVGYQPGMFRSFTAFSPSPVPSTVRPAQGGPLLGAPALPTPTYRSAPAASSSSRGGPHSGSNWGATWGGRGSWGRGR